MRNMLMSVLLVCVVLALTGCSIWIGVSAGEIVRSEKQRVTSPDVAEADGAELVAGNTAFAFDLYQAIAEQDRNIFFSPYSISLALAMAYAGARGETEQQMADTLHYTLPQERLHPAFNALDLALASRGKVRRA